MVEYYKNILVTKEIFYFNSQNKVYLSWTIKPDGIVLQNIKFSTLIQLNYLNICLFREQSLYKGLQKIQILYKLIFRKIAKKKLKTVIYAEQCQSEGDKMSRHPSNMPD